MASNCRYLRADAALVAALASGKSIEQASKETGLSVRAIYNRRQRPEFQAAMQAHTEEALTTALQALNEGAVLAALTLRQLLHSANDPVRLGAARTVMEILLRLREDRELAERLDRLEAELARATGD